MLYSCGTFFTARRFATRLDVPTRTSPEKMYADFMRDGGAQRVDAAFAVRTEPSRRPRAGNFENRLKHRVKWKGAGDEKRNGSRLRRRNDPRRQREINTRSKVARRRRHYARPSCRPFRAVRVLPRPHLRDRSTPALNAGKNRKKRNGKAGVNVDVDSGIDGSRIPVTQIESVLPIWIYFGTKPCSSARRITVIAFHCEVSFSPAANVFSTPFSPLVPRETTLKTNRVLPRGLIPLTGERRREKLYKLYTVALRML